jgi:hypothetical protein
MPSRPLLTNDSFRKERLSISSFWVPTGLKNQWSAISKTIAVSLYSYEFGFVTLLPSMSCTRHVVLKGVVQIVSSECDAYPTVSA